MLCNVNAFKINPVSNLVECKAKPLITLHDLSSEIHGCWSNERDTPLTDTTKERSYCINDSDISKIQRDCRTLTNVKNVVLLASYNTQVNEHTVSDIATWAGGLDWYLHARTLSFLTFMCNRGLNLVQCDVPVGKCIMELGTTVDQLWRCEKTATWILVDLRLAQIEVSGTGTPDIADSQEMVNVITQYYASTTTRPRWVRCVMEMCIQKWLFEQTFKVKNTSCLVVVIPTVSVRNDHLSPNFVVESFHTGSLPVVWTNRSLIRLVLALLRAHRKNARIPEPESESECECEPELETEFGIACPLPHKLGKRQIECVTSSVITVDPGEPSDVRMDELRSAVQAASRHLLTCHDPMAWFQWVHALLVTSSGSGLDSGVNRTGERKEQVRLSINSHVATLRYLFVSQFASLYSLPATMSGFSIITAGFLALGYCVFWSSHTVPAPRVPRVHPVFTAEQLQTHLLNLDTHMRSLLLYKPYVPGAIEPDAIQEVKKRGQFSKFMSPKLCGARNYLAHDVILHCNRLLYLTHGCTPDSMSTHDQTVTDNTLCVLDEYAYVWVHLQLTAKLVANTDDKWSPPTSCIHNIRNLLSTLIKIEPDVTMRNAFMDLVYRALSCNALYERYRRKQGLRSSAKPPVMIVLQECVPAKELHQVLVELNTRTMQQLYVRQCDWYEWMQLSLISSMVLIRFRVDIVKTYLITGSDICTEYNRLYNPFTQDDGQCANGTRANGPRIYSACGIWGVIYAPREPIPCGSCLEAFALWLGIWGVYFEGVTEEGFNLQLLIDEVFQSETSNWEECFTNYI
jgi:hypothetical protein